MRVVVTDGDTIPLGGEYQTDGVAVNLTGYAVDLIIGYTPTPLTKAATILTQSTNQGKFEFRWSGNDLRVGTWSAQLRITNPGTQVEFTEQFALEVEARL